MDQRPQHFAAGVEIDQRKLNALVCRQGLAKRLARIGMSHCFVDAVLGSTETGGRLTYPVFIKKVLDDHQSFTFTTENGAVRHPDIGKGNPGVVRGHIERPQILLNLQPRRVHGDKEGGDTIGLPGLARGARHNEVAVGSMHAGVPGLLAVYHPVIAIALGHGLHIGGV